MSRRAVTNADLEKSRLSVVRTDGTEPEDATPDASWGLDRLVAYAEAQLTISERAEQESLLQARKSAAALFRAGSALYFVRAERKSKGRGEWTKLKRERGWKDTTANDAIRLYENAKTPDALAGLGITEAKVKYVYPSKLTDDEEDGQEESSPTAAVQVVDGKRGQRNKRGPKHADQHDDEEVDEVDDPEAAVEPSEPAIITELSGMAQPLNEMAQRLSEIALNDLGKVDVAQNLDAFASAMSIISNAAAAVSDAAQNLYHAINRRLPDV